MTLLSAFRRPLIAATTVAALAIAAMPAAAADEVSAQSDAILTQSALDERRADNGTTPIAVHLEGRIYGARTTPYPYSASESTIAGTAYYVDCGDATEDATGGDAEAEATAVIEDDAQGTGTREEPFTSLEAANAVTLQPGDAMLFKGGSVCAGTFAPKGSGTQEQPITIDAYDASKEDRARIDAQGGVDAMLVQDVEHYVIRNLELTNTAGDGTDYTIVRHGLRIVNQNQGTLSGFDIANLYVHDVLGNNKKNAAGIRLEVLGSAVKSKFSGVEIAYNELRHVNRTGIVAATDWWQREEAEYWGGTYYPQDPIHIHDNFLTDIGGDGIVVWAAPDSIVEYNTLENAANEHGGKSDNSHNAGIWAWVTDRIVFRNNHVFDMHRSADNNDGAAFDADTGGTGQIFEHNLTHDNAGGFIMYCGCWGLSTNISARYNLSLNDGRFVDLDPVAEPTGETARTVFMAGSTDSHFYNNTILLPPTDVNIAGYGHYMVNNVAMVNNLYLAQQGTVVSDTTTGVDNNTLTWRNNIFAGPAQGWPTDGTDNQVVSNLGLGTGSGLAQLQIRSDEVLAHGYPVADPHGEKEVLDFLGNPVPTVTSPDVGAFQYSKVPQQVTVADGGFEQCDSTAWSKNAITVTDGQRSGARALSVNGEPVTQTVSAAINRTYRAVAAVKPAGESAALPQVSITLPSGASMTLAPQTDKDGKAIADGTGWVGVSGVFRTAADASTFTIGISGTGLIDDVSIEGVDDLMVDGAFESPTNTVWQPAIVLEGTPANAAENGTIDRSEDAVTGKYAAPVPATGTRLNADWAQEPFTGDAYNRFTYVAPGENYDLGVWAKAKESSEVTLAWENFAGWRADYPLTLSNVKGSVSTNSGEYTRLNLPLVAEQEQIVVACQGEGLCDDMTLVAAWDGSVPAIAAGNCTSASEPSEADKPTTPSNDGSTGSEGKGNGDTSGDAKGAGRSDGGSAEKIDGKLSNSGSAVAGVIVLATLLMLIGAVAVRSSRIRA